MWLTCLHVQVTQTLMNIVLQAPAGNSLEPQASRGSVRSRVSHNGADLHTAGGFGASPHGDSMSGLSSPEARP